MKVFAYLNYSTLVYFLIMAFLISCQPVRQQNDQKDIIHLTIDPAHLPPIAKLSDDNQGDTLTYIPTSPQTFAQITSFWGNSYGANFYSARGRDTIWQIEKGSFKPVLICDFGSGHIDPKEYERALFSPHGIPSSKLIISGLAFCNPDYFHFLLDRQNKDGDYRSYHVIVNKINQQSWHFAHGEGSDDVLFANATFFQTASFSSS